MTTEQYDNISQQRVCKMIDIPRSTYYYTPITNIKVKYEKLLNTIEYIIFNTRIYGYRRVTEELRKYGFRDNRKRVLIIMRENKLIVKKKRRYVNTTNYNHSLSLYPNLIKYKSITAPNQVWASDITYIPLSQGAAYFCVILDVFSRKVIGYCLSKSIDTNMTIIALRKALSTRKITKDIIHHSDRGIQYASNAYTDLLKKNNIAISMSAKGNPYDNAMVESFFKTLKQEEIYVNEYKSFDDAKIKIYNYIDNYYNIVRLHSSINNKPPEIFEKNYYETFNISKP